MSETLDDRPAWVAGLPSWMPGPQDHGEAFARKRCGRIYVRSAEDADRVRSIARTIDESEVDVYMNPDFITVWKPDSPMPPLIYGHKFELRIDILRHLCFEQGVMIYCVTGVREP